MQNILHLLYRGENDLPLFSCWSEAQKVKILSYLLLGFSAVTLVSHPKTPEIAGQHITYNTEPLSYDVTKANYSVSLFNQ